MTKCHDGLLGAPSASRRAEFCRVHRRTSGANMGQFEGTSFEAHDGVIMMHRPMWMAKIGEARERSGPCSGPRRAPSEDRLKARQVDNPQASLQWNWNSSAEILIARINWPHWKEAEFGRRTGDGEDAESEVGRDHASIPNSSGNVPVVQYSST
jgi:hypothetical protein